MADKDNNGKQVMLARPAYDTAYELAVELAKERGQAKPNVAGTIAEALSLLKSQRQGESDNER